MDSQSTTDQSSNAIISWDHYPALRAGTVDITPRNGTQLLTVDVTIDSYDRTRSAGVHGAVQERHRMMISARGVGTPIISVFSDEPIRALEFGMCVHQVDHLRLDGSIITTIRRNHPLTTCDDDLCRCCHLRVNGIRWFDLVTDYAERDRVRVEYAAERARVLAEHAAERTRAIEHARYVEAVGIDAIFTLAIIMLAIVTVLRNFVG